MDLKETDDPQEAVNAFRAAEAAKAAEGEDAAVDFNKEKKQFMSENQLPAEAEAAKKVMAQEYGRRLEVSGGLGADMMLASNLSLDNDTINVRAENQNVIAIRFSNRKQNPPSDRPAFMILGGYVDVDEFTGYYNKYKSAFDEGGATWKCTASDWVPCMTSIEKQLDNNLKRKHVGKVLENHKTRIEDDRKEFQDNVQNARGLLEPDNEERDPSKRGMVMKEHEGRAGMGKTGYSMYKSRKKASNKKSAAAKRRRVISKMHKRKAEEEERHIAPPFSRSAQRRGQNWAVVSFLCDNTAEVIERNGNPEPLIRVHGLFEDADEAKEWRDEHLKDRVKYYDIDIVMVGEWLFPEDIDLEKLKEEYRNSEQQSIMQQRKEKKKELKAYEQYCKDEGIETNETVVDIDGNVIKTTNNEDIVEAKVDDEENVIFTCDQAIASLQRKLDADNALKKLHKKGPKARELKEGRDRRYQRQGRRGYQGSRNA